MKQLPVMWNLGWLSLIVLVLAVGALAMQAHESIDWGEAEWGLITLVARELLAITSRVATYYTGERE